MSGKISPKTVVHSVGDVLEQGPHGRLQRPVVARRLSDDIEFFVLWVKEGCVGCALAISKELVGQSSCHIPKICSRIHLTVLYVVRACGGICDPVSRCKWTEIPAFDLP